ncbi:MAG: hypothetical protein KDD45_02870 [Bdellovibrionales bacterium]|nr:hypothetical protein [Bdellovibrionales bacterium]
MSAYIKQEHDFIIRTKKIIDQYNKFQIQKTEKFEITLFLNCLVGLLILPQQHWYESLPTDNVSQKEWGISPKHISTIKKGELKNVMNVARHLRNSVAHYNFTVFDNRLNKLSSVQFTDKITEKGKDDIITFEAVIPLKDLRQFTTKLTYTFTTLMEQSK